MTDERTLGSEYDEKIDGGRLRTQLETIREYMLRNNREGRWRTLSEIHADLGDRFPEPSVSAQLRHLRKVEFGNWYVQKRRRDDEKGTYEYTVTAYPGAGREETEHTHAQQVVEGPVDMAREKPRAAESDAGGTRGTGSAGKPARQGVLIPDIDEQIERYP